MLKRLKGLFAPVFAFFGYAGDFAEAVVADDAGSLPTEVAPPDEADFSVFRLPDNYAGVSTIETSSESPKYKRAVIIDAKSYRGRGCTNANGRAKKAYESRLEAQRQANKYPGMTVYNCKTHGWHVAHELSRGLRGAITVAKKSTARKKSIRKSAAKTRAKKKS